MYPIDCASLASEGLTEITPFFAKIRGVAIVSANCSRHGFASSHLQRLPVEIPTRFQEPLIPISHEYGRSTSSDMRLFGLHDLDAAAQILQPVANYYPGFYEWLPRAFLETTTGYTIVPSLLVHNRPAAILILRFKKGGALKISTLFVTEPYRREGYGTILLWYARERFCHCGLNSMYVTFDESLAPQYIGLLQQHGFTFAGLSAGRYGDNRVEVVYRLISSKSC